MRDVADMRARYVVARLRRRPTTQTVIRELDPDDTIIVDVDTPAFQPASDQTSR